jgi:hypothetical protein
VPEFLDLVRQWLGPSRLSERIQVRMLRDRGTRDPSGLAQYYLEGKAYLLPAELAQVFFKDGVAEPVDGASDASST